MQVILVDPPDPDRLRYLTTTDPTVRANDHSAALEHLGAQNSYGPGARLSEDEGEVEEMLCLVGPSSHIQQNDGRT